MSSPTVSRQVAMVGNGMARDVDQTLRDVTPADPGSDIRTITTGPTADVTGWETPGSQSNSCSSGAPGAFILPSCSFGRIIFTTSPAVLI